MAAGVRQVVGGASGSEGTRVIGHHDALLLCCKHLPKDPDAPAMLEGLAVCPYTYCIAKSG